MISNPATFFINNSDEREFTYEGGTTLFHWSPYESDLSKSMESNVVFFANNVDHAQDVLRRLFWFWIDCREQYIQSKENDYHGFVSSAEAEVQTLRHYLDNLDRMVVSKAPTNQFYKVGWACNDNLNVYDRVPIESLAADQQVSGDAQTTAAISLNGVVIVRPALPPASGKMANDLRLLPKRSRASFRHRDLPASPRLCHICASGNARHARPMSAVIKEPHDRWAGLPMPSCGRPRWRLMLRSIRSRNFTHSATAIKP